VFRERLTGIDFFSPTKSVKDRRDLHEEGGGGSGSEEEEESRNIDSEYIEALNEALQADFTPQISGTNPGICEY
jgi:hypothetical protein